MQVEEEEAASNWLKETQKGYLRIATLILLSKKTYHGYEIMKEIKRRTRGFWKPTAGGIYPVLKDLQKSGYVVSEWVFEKKRKRRIYNITEAGKAVLERALAKEGQIANSMSDLIKEFMKDVLDVKTMSIPMPKMPNFFSVFLEERKEKPEDTINVLEHKRTQIENMIKALQKELVAINKRLDQLKQSRRHR
jgi:DNA-binding PadR family transcriptional regulator